MYEACVSKCLGMREPILVSIPGKCMSLWVCAAESVLYTQNVHFEENSLTKWSILCGRLGMEKEDSYVYPKE